jgi:DNA modification methylase
MPKTNRKITAEDVFRMGGDSVVRDKDTKEIYDHQKPVKLYSSLLDVFKPDKSLHVLDVCSGAGSCAVACKNAQYKCLVIEKSLVRCRLIEQRLKC